MANITISKKNDMFSFPSTHWWIKTVPPQGMSDFISTITCGRFLVLCFDAIWTPNCAHRPSCGLNLLPDSPGIYGQLK